MKRTIGFCSIKLIKSALIWSIQAKYIQDVTLLKLNLALSR